MTNDNGDGAKLSLPSMRRRLCRRRDCVFALIVMASLLSSMHRRLAVVNDDGNGVMGDDDYDDFDDATDFAVVAMASLPSPMRRRLAVVNDDGDGATGDKKVDDDGNGAMGDDIDDDGKGATYNDIDNDCNGTTGDKVDDDCEGATGDEVGYNGACNEEDDGR